MVCSCHNVFSEMYYIVVNDTRSLYIEDAIVCASNLSTYLPKYEIYFLAFL